MHVDFTKNSMAALNMNLLLKFDIPAAWNFKRVTANCSLRFSKKNMMLKVSIIIIKSHVYGKPLTSASIWEFFKIEHKQIKTVQNNSYG